MSAFYVLGTLVDTLDTVVKKEENSFLHRAYVPASMFLSKFLLEKKLMLHDKKKDIAKCVSKRS